MKTLTYSKFFLSGFIGLLLFTVSPVFAQDTENEPAEAEETETYTQGQAALVIARRLGLCSGTVRAPTQARAIQLLSALDIAPAGGWVPEDPLSPGGFARVMVKALGLEGELSEEEIAGDSDQAYFDILNENYGVDLQRRDRVLGSIVGSGDIATSSDPLDGADLPAGDTREEIPVSQEDVNATLAAISGGNTGGGGNNITPSAP